MRPIVSLLTPLLLSLSATLVAGPGAAQTTSSRLVLITLDGVRWQDVVGPRAASLPNLARFVTDGGLLLGGDDQQVRLQNQSTVSLPGYRELFTGRVDPRCNSNRCEPLEVETLFDHAALRDGARVAVIASWEGLRHATSTRAIPPFLRSAGRRDPESPALARRVPSVQSLISEGDRVGPAPGHDHYRPDAFTAAIALEVLDQLEPDLLVVGFGDTDEWAHRRDRRRYRAALAEADRFVGEVMATVDGQDGCPALNAATPCPSRRTTIVVTTDHGRSARFHDHGGATEAARIWLALRGPRFSAVATVPGVVAATDLAPTLAVVLGLDLGAFSKAGASLRFALSH